MMRLQGNKYECNFQTVTRMRVYARAHALNESSSPLQEVISFEEICDYTAVYVWHR